MFVHSVYFWLKPELTTEERAAFTREIQALREISTVRACIIGPPAASDKPVIDGSYDYGLVLAFEDRAGEEAYLTHPLHRAFADKWRSRWTVKIYDCEE